MNGVVGESHPFGSKLNVVNADEVEKKSGEAVIGS